MTDSKCFWLNKFNDEGSLIQSLCNFICGLDLSDVKIKTRIKNGCKIDECRYKNLYCGVYIVIKNGVLYVSTQYYTQKVLSQAILDIRPDLKLYGRLPVGVHSIDSNSNIYCFMRKCFRDFLFTQDYCPKLLCEGGVISYAILNYLLLLYFYSKEIFTVNGQTIDHDFFFKFIHRPIIDQLLLEHLIPDIQKSVNYEIVPIERYISEYKTTVIKFLSSTTCYMDYPDCSLHDYYLPDYDITMSELMAIEKQLISKYKCTQIVHSTFTEQIALVLMSKPK